MAKMLQMTDEEYQLFNDLISDQIGLTFPPHKKQFLETRLGPRVVESGLRHFSDYYLMLTYSGNGELQKLTDSLTNNETYFFREKDQFSMLFDRGLDDLKKGCKDQTISVLSAGCASGEEPYSLNIFAKQNQHRLWAYQMEIDAFDVDSVCLSRAQDAAYASRSVSSMEADEVPLFFTVSESNNGPRYTLKMPYRQGVRFWKGNIVDVSSYLQRPYYDVIFCRNVLIYFSEAALHRAVKNFAARLRPGGLLFLGHSESIIGLSNSFETIRIGSCLAYVRV